MASGLPTTGPVTEPVTRQAAGRRPFSCTAGQGTAATTAGWSPCWPASTSLSPTFAGSASRTSTRPARPPPTPPPLPGIGSRILAVDAQREFWYQSFHQLALAERLIDGQPSAVRAYLEHFWSHWSGPLDEFFDAVRLRWLPESGHFSPMEAPEVFAAEILAAAAA